MVRGRSTYSCAVCQEEGGACDFLFVSERGGSLVTVCKVVDLSSVCKVVDLGPVCKVVDLSSVWKVVKLGSVCQVVDLGSVCKVVELGSVFTVVDLGSFYKMVDLGSLSEVVGPDPVCKVVELGLAVVDLPFQQLPTPPNTIPSPFLELSVRSWNHLSPKVDKCSKMTFDCGWKGRVT